MLHYKPDLNGIDMKTEVWATLKKYPRYKVSNWGRVVNIKTGHVMKNHLDGSGYYRVQLTIKGKNHHLAVHRLVLYTFVNNPDPEHLTIVNHLDENTHNNRLDNLEFCDREWNATWGTVRERIQHTRKVKQQLVGVYVINKLTKRALKFDTLKDASLFSGVNTTMIRKALRNWRTKIEGKYVFCLPKQYKAKFVEKLINNSLGYHYQIYNGVYAINVETKESLFFDSLKQLGKKLHIREQKVNQLIKNPRDKNPYPYVFCDKEYYSSDYIEFLLKVRNGYAGQSIAIAGMNINTGEVRHFKSIKQAEHTLNNQSVQPYLSGKVKSAKDWVFCKEYEYSKKLLQQKAREAKPNNNFEIVILNCKTGNAITTTDTIHNLSVKYGITESTIRNQLNHNAVSMTGQQFIYKDNYDDQNKQLFMDVYNRKGRGKAVYAINIDTLKITKYSSISDAISDLRINRQRIQSAIHGDNNQVSRYAFSYETYYSKFRMYLLAYYGKYGKDGFPVSSVDKNGKQVFYPAVKEAAKQTGIAKGNIFRAIRVKGRTAGGYNWFKEDRDKYIKSLI